VIRDKLGRVYDRLTDTPSDRRLWALLVASIGLLVVSVPAVLYLLELSNYPGELEATQLGFDGEYIRSCFSDMSGADVSFFIMGNLVDYLFMVSYGVLLFSSSLILSRRLRQGSLGRKAGYTASILGLLAACCDGLENVFLLSMASNPIDFPGWLAIPHSLFASIKFDLMYVASAWILVALAYVVVRWILKPRSPVLNVSEVVHSRAERIVSGLSDAEIANALNSTKALKAIFDIPSRNR
jgi:hypothetical protein